MFHNKKNESECGWICAAQIGASSTEMNTDCIIMQIPNVSVSGSIDMTLINGDLEKKSRKSRYQPIYQNTTFPSKFNDLINKTVLIDVQHLQLHHDYWEGWIRSHSAEDLGNFLWIYHHQMHTVYVKNCPVELTKGKVLPLQQSQVVWTLDKNIKNKYIQRIGTLKLLCQRSKQRNKRKTEPKRGVYGSLKGECSCYLKIILFQIMTKGEDGNMVNDQSQIAVLSDNLPECHDHDLSWKNRRNAPIHFIFVGVTG